MTRYFIRRLLYCVLIIFGALLLTFVLFDLAAGDPAAAALGEKARPDEVENLRRELGSDLPLFFGKRCLTEAFTAWRGDKIDVTVHRNFAAENLEAEITYDDGSTNACAIAADATELRVHAPTGKKVVKIDFFRLQSNPFNSRAIRSIKEFCSVKSEFPYLTFFNFGNTITTRESISGILKRCILPSCLLMFPIFFGETLFGIVFALVAVAFHNRWQDRLLSLIAVAGMSISYITIIIFAQWGLGYYLNLFPVWGFGEARHLYLPIVVGTICGIGSNMRFYRSVFTNELRKEYLRTATAKGASPLRVYGGHLLKNATIQIITRTSSSLPFLFTGSLLLESFFGIPGLGFAGVDALYNSDIQLLKALVVTSALLFVFFNLLADLLCAWADPRFRLE